MAAAKTSRGAKAAAAAASIAAHLIFLVILVQQTSQVTPRHAWPTYTVELMPPVVTERTAPKPRPTKREVARPPPATFSAPPTAAAPRPLVLPTVPPSPTVEPLPVAPMVEDPVVAAARQAVREGFGCNPKLLARLSGAEQEACRRHDRQYAARKSQGPGATASLDLEGRFAKPNPDEPYLARKPEKGCKPRVGGAGGDGTSNDHFVPGITCVFRF